MRLIKLVVISVMIGLGSLRAQPVQLNMALPNPIRVEKELTLLPAGHTNEYLFSKWVPGYLYYANGSFKAFDSLNFNQYSQQVEVVKNNKVIQLGATALQGVLLLKEPEMGIMLVKFKNNTKNILGVVESSGRVILASYIKATQLVIVKNYKVDEIRFVAKPKESVEISKHYKLYKNSSWQDYKLTKGSIAKAFNLSKKQLQEKTKQAGLNFYSQEGSLKVFILLNKQ